MHDSHRLLAWCMNLPPGHCAAEALPAAQRRSNAPAHGALANRMVIGHRCVVHSVRTPPVVCLAVYGSRTTRRLLVSEPFLLCRSCELCPSTPSQSDSLTALSPGCVGAAALFVGASEVNKQVSRLASSRLVISSASPTSSPLPPLRALLPRTLLDADGQALVLVVPLGAPVVD